MSQLGVYDVDSRRAARRSGASADTEKVYHRRARGAGPPHFIAAECRSHHITGVQPPQFLDLRIGGIIGPAMAYIAGKSAFLPILKQEGVSVMFGNPGTTELPLMDGLPR